MPRWKLRRLPAAVPLTLALAFLPRPGSAQAPPSAEPRRTLQVLQDSAHLRLTAPGVYVEDGFFLGFRSDSVRVADADAVFQVSAGEIESLAVRGSKWLGVGAQSAAVGVVAGALAGFFYGTRDCGQVLQGCDAHATRVALRWGVEFGVGAGLLGAVVGSRLFRWRAVFP